MDQFLQRNKNKKKRNSVFFVSVKIAENTVASDLVATKKSKKTIGCTQAFEIFPEKCNIKFKVLTKDKNAMKLYEKRLCNNVLL